VTHLRSTGATREFAPDPVDDDVVHRILDTARFAPNGGNRQGWRVVVVKDASVRAGLRDLYVEGWREYLAMGAAGLTPWAPVTDRVAESRALASLPDGDPGAFATHFDEVPALLVVLADLRRLAAVDRDLPRYTLVGGASIYPFVWSILLAARDEGLGGVITTMTIRREPEMRALLGVPDELAVAAVVALGKPAGPMPTKLRREPVSAFTTVDRYDGPAFEPPA
jgi:nitroreductase